MDWMILIPQRPENRQFAKTGPAPIVGVVMGRVRSGGHCG